MCTLLEMKRRIQSVDMIDHTAKGVRATERDLVEWQQDQMYVGKKKTGGKITPGYRPRTKSIKRKKGQPTDRVTLKDTGAFYSEMTVGVSTSTYSITSLNKVSPYLTDKYGEEIWGLNKISRQGYVEQNLQPVVIFNVKNELKV